MASSYFPFSLVGCFWDSVKALGSFTFNNLKKKKKSPETSKSEKEEQGNYVI
jgi:hypothetical protein